MNAIEITNVSVRIGRNPILSDITADIPAGRITGLLGPSGAGKTTLMRAIVGLQRMTAGSIAVLGQPAGTAQLRHEIGYLTQAPSVYNDLSVSENLQYFGAIVGVDNHRVEEVMDDVGLSSFSKQLTATLSGGQMARLSLAAALLGKPKVLVLDEPTVGQDPVLRDSLWSQFYDLTEKGVTILVSSHVMDEARRCDKLLFIREGKILTNDSPKHIMEQTDTYNLEDAFLRLVNATE